GRERAEQPLHPPRRGSFCALTPSLTASTNSPPPTRIRESRPVGPNTLAIRISQGNTKSRGRRDFFTFVTRWKGATPPADVTSRYCCYVSPVPSPVTFRR